jgi:orotate phosphoribosyltransferase-like protein
MEETDLAMVLAEIADRLALDRDTGAWLLETFADYVKRPDNHNRIRLRLSLQAWQIRRGMALP